MRRNKNGGRFLHVKLGRICSHEMQTDGQPFIYLALVQELPQTATSCDVGFAINYRHATLIRVRYEWTVSFLQAAAAYIAENGVASVSAHLVRAAVRESALRTEASQRGARKRVLAC